MDGSATRPRNLPSSLNGLSHRAPLRTIAVAVLPGLILRDKVGDVDPAEKCTGSARDAVADPHDDRRFLSTTTTSLRPEFGRARPSSMARRSRAIPTSHWPCKGANDRVGRPRARSRRGSGNPPPPSGIERCPPRRVTQRAEDTRGQETFRPAPAVEESHSQTCGAPARRDRRLQRNLNAWRGQHRWRRRRLRRSGRSGDDATRIDVGAVASDARNSAQGDVCGSSNIPILRMPKVGPDRQRRCPPPRLVSGSQKQSRRILRFAAEQPQTQMVPRIDLPGR